MVRGDARATCLALRIARDGTVTLTNAGHLPPYLNGEPVEIEGSLPLGFSRSWTARCWSFPWRRAIGWCGCPTAWWRRRT